MRRTIIFLLAVVLLVGCSNGTAVLPTSTFEITETQPVKISPTATPGSNEDPNANCSKGKYHNPGNYKWYSCQQ